MKFRKIMAVVLAALVVFTIAACGNGNGGNDNGEEVNGNGEAAAGETITIWAWDEAFNIRAMNLAAEMYADINPDVHIDIVTMAQDDVVAALNTSLAAGSYDGLPNIVLIEDYRGPGFLEAFQGEFADLSGVVSPADFAPFKAAISQRDGGFFSVPFDSGVAALFYRLDLIEEAGFTGEDMEYITWERYIEIGLAVQEATGVDMLTLDPSDGAQVRMMLQSSGAWYTDEDGEVTLAGNEALKAAFQVYKDIVEAGIYRPVADWDQFVGAFNNGDVASVITGCWIAPSVRSAEEQYGDWRIAAFPRVGAYANSVNASSLGGSSWYVLENVENAELAKSFLQHTVGSSVDLMNTLAEEINLVSTLIAAEAAENYSLGVDFFGGQEIFGYFAEWTANVPAVYYGMHTYLIEDMVVEALQRFIAGEDLETLLEEYQQQAEAAIR